MIGKLVVGVQLSYIPTCFTDEDCVNCHQILDVKVIESEVLVFPKVLYVPKNIGQFFIEFETGQVITNFLFKYSIQINKNLAPKYRSCFTEQDYAQYIEEEVQTATLSKYEPQQVMDLTLDGLDNPEDPTSSIPPAALDILS